MQKCSSVRALVLGSFLIGCTGLLRAQPAAAAPAASAASAPAPTATPRPAAPGQQVQITGARESDTDVRRQSTAAKIVIGREEIEKFGDASVAEVLRRLPGVTTPGAPGRGGPPRMRGLGGGFTQILIDGQRMPPGFSLDSLTPEQLERIEILRAPTAETGARAIAGTINIITREGFKARLNDLRIGMGFENGEFTPGLFWTHNNSAGPLTYNLSAGTFRNQRQSSGDSENTTTELASGRLLEGQTSHLDTAESRRGLNLSGRLSWRLSGTGDTLMLMPSLFASQGRANRQFSLNQSLPAPPALPLYDLGQTLSESSFVTGRVGLSWRQRLTPASRLEVNGGLGRSKSSSSSDRDEFRRGVSVAVRHNDDDARTAETTGNLSFKLSSLLGGNVAEPGTEHSLVSGAEVEGVQRSESRITLQNGVPLLTEFGDNLKASSLRVAAYVQDEWSLNANWSLHAGLRWEGITTRGDGAGNNDRPSNRSSVLTPLVHLLWKPDPKSRDQVRLSLTRSYRSPGVSQLIARPNINSRFPVSGPNEPTSPDSAGNPNLKPELASGLDLAYERYLTGGGVLSANLFYRHINNLMRSVTTLETVSYSRVPRWVSRQQNIGSAATQGIELEAKYRLDQLIDGALPVELRHNLSLYRSHVKGIPGPDNRLDSQSPASANFGADYRLRSLPITLGGNLNWTPGYRSQLADDRSTRTGSKSVVDGFVLWAINPQTGLRLLGSNLSARDYESSGQFDYSLNGVALRDSTRSFGPSYVSWQLRLELKL